MKGLIIQEAIELKDGEELILGEIAGYTMKVDIERIKRLIDRVRAENKIDVEEIVLLTSSEVYSLLCMSDKLSIMNTLVTRLFGAKVMIDNSLENDEIKIATILDVDVPILLDK